MGVAMNKNQSAGSDAALHARKDAAPKGWRCELEKDADYSVEIVGRPIVGGGVGMMEDNVDATRFRQTPRLVDGIS